MYLFGIYFLQKKIFWRNLFFQMVDSGHVTLLVFMPVRIWPQIFGFKYIFLWRNFPKFSNKYLTIKREGVGSWAFFKSLKKTICRELTEKPKLSNEMRYHFNYMEFSLNITVSNLLMTLKFRHDKALLYFSSSISTL